MLLKLQDGIHRIELYINGSLIEVNKSDLDFTRLSRINLINKDITYKSTKKSQQFLIELKLFFNKNDRLRDTSIKTAIII